MNNNNLYNKGYIINYKEGDKSIQRDTLVYKENLDDQLYTIRQDDTLTAIAYKFYKDPLKWFIIADINNIFNPFDLTIGDEIIIPALSNYDGDN